MNVFQRAAAAGVEGDARVEEARRLEEQLREARQRKRDLAFEISSLEISLQGSLLDFYNLGTAALKLSLDPRIVIKMIQNGAIFGLKIDGKWYAEKEEVDTKAELA